MGLCRGVAHSWDIGLRCIAIALLLFFLSFESKGLYEFAGRRRCAGLRRPTFWGDMPLAIAREPTAIACALGLIDSPPGPSF